MNKCELLSVERAGEYLRLKIEHNGSEGSSFHLSWDGAVMKSLPPIARLKLKAELAAGSKRKTQLMDFDLSAMRHFGKTITVTFPDEIIPPFRFEFSE